MDRSRFGLFAIVLLASVAPAAEPGWSNRSLSAPALGPSLRSQSVAAQPKLIDFVAEGHREAVSSVLKSPTISTKASEAEFTAHPQVYDWLLEHPDRCSLAWQRLKIPCIEIADKGKAGFSWTDENGSELTWQKVGEFENGWIWYASGKIKAGALLPSVPVKAVAVLHAPRGAPEADGSCLYKPTVSVSIQCESRLANAAMRIAGPSAPKMAEEGAEQLLFYFSGVARYLNKKPDQIEPLLKAAKKK